MPQSGGFWTAMSIFALVLSASLLSAQAELPGDTPDFTFPEELQLIPLDVQEAASETDDAAVAEVPDGLSPAEVALYRAQLAWVNEDWVLARRYAETAASGGDTMAAIMAGLIARDGRDGEGIDLERAITWFRRAADAENTTAMFELGKIARDSRWTSQIGSPRRWFEQAARAGHRGAMLSLGLELRASGIPQEQVDARAWFERAARAGLAEGMYQYAQMLDQGEGGHRDQVLARQWFEMAAEDRHAEAALQAAIMYAEGDGGMQDDDRARELMRISAESGYPPAQGQYGLMMYQGRGGEPDATMAGYWFEQGARGGDAESQFLLAYVLAQGDGRRQDFDRAYYWTLLAEHDAEGAWVDNPARDQLRTALERVLSPADATRIRAEVATQP